MLPLLHHCQVTEAVPDQHSILFDFITYVKVNIFSGNLNLVHLKIEEGRVHGGESSRLASNQRAPPQHFQPAPFAWAVFTKSAQHSWRDLALFVGTSSHMLPANIPLQGKLPGQPKLMQHTEKDAYILPENCSHFQSNFTKLYFNLLFFYLFFFTSFFYRYIKHNDRENNELSKSL